MATKPVAVVVDYFVHNHSTLAAPSEESCFNATQISSLSFRSTKVSSLISTTLPLKNLPSFVKALQSLCSFLYKFNFSKNSFNSTTHHLFVHVKKRLSPIFITRTSCRNPRTRSAWNPIRTSHYRHNHILFSAFSSSMTHRSSTADFNNLAKSSPNSCSMNFHR